MAPQGYWAHGRYYGNWRLGKYLIPIDAEELNRLDIFHKFFLVARGNALTSCNLLKLNHPARVLDLGTGTGIWAISICEESAHTATVMAVDLNRIQPQFIPRGMAILQFDIEDPSWGDIISPPYDLVHMRTLLGSIHNECWPTIYRNIFQRLAPGTGCLEQVEIDWNPQWEEHGEVPPNSALREWANRLLEALDSCKRSARILPQRSRRMIEDAGFVDFDEQTIRCYVNPWSPNQNEREAAKWFNLGLGQGLEAMGVLPMVEHLGMTAEQVRSLCERVIEENSKLRYRGYCTIEEAWQQDLEHRLTASTLAAACPTPPYQPGNAKAY
ncbi:methyl transferase [Purpureocillium lilacinum]|uniref:Methyl transferase n=1 Tax=Purpureocillium lilacinum TaxID=33203 RepID=A0A179HX14_PURLI|nr:methyl transferase [Purpureocillium lilacinum]OAQ93910.1 methyl transferase [Purpureocillium lilacinum]